MKAKYLLIPMVILYSTVLAWTIKDEGLTTEDPKARTVERVEKGRSVQVAPGFNVVRPIPTRRVDEYDPFLMLDHFGPREVPADYTEYVPPHPHCGFQPVTLVFKGRVGHHDSMGNRTEVSGGGAQWLTAGNGMMHSERFGVEDPGDPMLHGIQLWVNVPAEHKFDDPGYMQMNAEDITEGKVDDAQVRVYAGEVNGIKGNATTYSPLTIAYLKFDGEGTADINIPTDWNAYYFVMTGRTADAGANSVVRLNNDGELVHIESKEATEVLLLTGEPLNEPIVSRGPFITNTQQEMREALQRYQAGEMGELED